MTRRFLLSLAATLLMVFSAHAEEDDGVVVGDDGLFKAPFFHDSFLEFGDDLQEAADQGKHLMILIEQKGCPYCRELHKVNFKNEEIVAYLNEHYVVIQLDLYGSRGTIDFDGEELEERDLVAKWGGQFTPTTILIDKANVGAKSLREAEAFRLPGYLKNFHYMSALEYVVTGAYHEQGFQRFIQEKGDRLRTEGKEVDLW